jgi:hypothetical protein
VLTLESALALDLLDRLLAGELFAAVGSIRIKVRMPVLAGLRHLDPLLHV